jgi:hypothetical protein
MVADGRKQTPTKYEVNENYYNAFQRQREAFIY